jgi:glycosyltransferase involved in cell wall biosynthesis
LRGTGLSRPVVSIVTRSVGRPKLLPRTLASVQAQRFPDWELLLVDDSGDAAALEVLARATLGAEPRLRVIERDGPAGRSQAMRRGFAAARGRYLVVLDDDDTWEPDFLAVAVAYLDDPAHAEEIGVATGLQIVTERPDAAGGWREVDRIEQPPPARRLRLAELLAPRNVQPNALLMRRAALAGAGDYPADHPVAEDWAFHLRFAASGPVGTIPRPLARYHLRPGVGGVEGNAIFTGLHADFVELARERELRSSLAADPTRLGLLLWLEERLARQERRLEGLELALRPLAFAGRVARAAARPPRRWWRRLRGRGRHERA